MYEQGKKQQKVCAGGVLSFDKGLLMGDHSFLLADVLCYPNPGRAGALGKAHLRTTGLHRCLYASCAWEWPISR
jgi:hypothetical protein